MALYCVMIGDPVARFQNFSFYVFNVYTHKCIYIYCVMIGDPVTHWNYVVCPPCFQNFRFQKFCIAVTQSLLRRACLIFLIFFFVRVANVHCKSHWPFIMFRETVTSFHALLLLHRGWKLFVLSWSFAWCPLWPLCLFPATMPVQFLERKLYRRFV